MSNPCPAPEILDGLRALDSATVVEQAKRVRKAERDFFKFLKGRSYNYEQMKRRIGAH